MEYLTQSPADNVGGYRIWDTRVRQFIGRVYTRARDARRRADNLNLEYGAIRYNVLPI